jgi:hypothetical protein
MRLRPCDILLATHPCADAPVNEKNSQEDQSPRPRGQTHAPRHSQKQQERAKQQKNELAQETKQARGRSHRAGAAGRHEHIIAQPLLLSKQEDISRENRGTRVARG